MSSGYACELSSNMLLDISVAFSRPFALALKNTCIVFNIFFVLSLNSPTSFEAVCPILCTPSFLAIYEYSDICFADWSIAFCMLVYALYTFNMLSSAIYAAIKIINIRLASTVIKPSCLSLAITLLSFFNALLSKLPVVFFICNLYCFQYRH